MIRNHRFVLMMLIPLLWKTNLNEYRICVDIVEKQMHLMFVLNVNKHDTVRKNVKLMTGNCINTSLYAIKNRAHEIFPLISIRKIIIKYLSSNKFSCNDIFRPVFVFAFMRIAN